MPQAFLRHSQTGWSGRPRPPLAIIVVIQVPVCCVGAAHGMVKDVGDPFLKWKIGEFPFHTGFPFSANILPPSLLMGSVLSADLNVATGLLLSAYPKMTQR